VLNLCIAEEHSIDSNVNDHMPIKPIYASSSQPVKIGSFTLRVMRPRDAKPVDFLHVATPHSLAP
jgi:hypothetical protein